jgi:hypothetical protein
LIKFKPLRHQINGMKELFSKKDVMNNWTFLAISSWFILWTSAVIFNIFNWNMLMPVNLIIMVYGNVFGAILLHRWFEKK